MRYMTAARKKVEFRLNLLAGWYSTWELFRYSGEPTLRQLALRCKARGIVAHDRVGDALRSPLPGTELTWPLPV